jgi:hypothetical protein
MYIYLPVFEEDVKEIIKKKSKNRRRQTGIFLNCRQKVMDDRWTGMSDNSIVGIMC